MVQALATMVHQVVTIAHNTFVESIRQPIFVVLVIVGAMGLVLNVPMTGYTLEADTKMLIEFGFSTLFLIGLLLAAFTATGVLYRELENKTVLTVISKPVARPLFVLGKYLGVSTAILTAYWILSTMFLLTVRHQVMQRASDQLDWPVILFSVGAVLTALSVATLANYFYQRVFTSTFIACLTATMTLAWALTLVTSKAWAFQSPLVDLNGQVLIGLLLISQLVLVITAVAIAASTRLGQVMTLLICAGVFVIGLTADYVLGRPARAEDATFLERAMYYISPNFQLHWPADALTNGSDFVSSYVFRASGHSILFIGAILALAMASFQTREVG